MPFNSILKLFLPKDRIFYNLFENVADNVLKMGELLDDLANEPEVEKRTSIINEIGKLEHENDSVTHKIFTELGRNFITPFDREDIHALASSLDDICDNIHACAKKVHIYKVNPTDSTFQKFARLIQKSCKEVHATVYELRNLKNTRKMSDSLVTINSLENQADDIFDLSIEALFENEQNIKEVIKKREIYQVLEIITDRCEDVANVIESILLKYA